MIEDILIKFFIFYFLKILFNVYIQPFSYDRLARKLVFFDLCTLNQTCIVSYYFIVFNLLFIFFYSILWILLFNSSFSL